MEVTTGLLALVLRAPCEDSILGYCIVRGLRIYIGVITVEISRQNNNYLSTDEYLGALIDGGAPNGYMFAHYSFCTKNWRSAC